MKNRMAMYEISLKIVCLIYMFYNIVFVMELKCVGFAIWQSGF
jgi:hypothetical protein